MSQKVRAVLYLACVVGLFLSPALAEDAAPTASGGPAIPGVCVLNREAVFTQSKVGKDVTAQFKAARDAAQSQVKDEEAKITSDAKALENAKAALPEGQYQSRLRDLVSRQQALRLEASQKSQDLEATRTSVVKRIAKAAQPFIAAAYGKYRCSLLLSRDAVLAGNPGMDVTADVIGGLDGKITVMKLERGKDDDI